MRSSKRLSGLSALLWSGSLAAALATSASAQSIVDLLARPGDHMGTTVVPAGDFDHDGIPDVLVGTDQTYGKHRATYVGGAASILSGRNGRMLFTVTGDDYQVLTGRVPGLDFGKECGMVGDFDGDGVCDVLAVHGSSKIVRKIVGLSGRTRAVLFEITDPYRRTNFGAQILRLGDIVDAAGTLVPDGVPDFAVTAPSNPISRPPPTYPGLVRIYSGAAPANGPIMTFVGQFALSGFGSAIAQVGDLDGDGVPAIAVSAPGRYVEFFDGPNFSPWYQLNSPIRRVAGFGSSLANLGDIDGNGTIELAIGAPGAQGGVGRVFVYSLDPGGPSILFQLDPAIATPGSGFGSSIVGLPVDPLTGRGLIDLDHDGNPDPFLDWNRDGTADFLIGAAGYDNFAGGSAGAGAFFLTRGTGATFQLAEDAFHQGPGDTFSYPYLPRSSPREDEFFGTRMVLLGNPVGESQVRIALGTPTDENYRGSLAVLRPPLLHFDDDTFSRLNDGVGSSRHLLLDFGPKHAGRRFQILGSTNGASPGQALQGFTVPLNDDGPGGLWSFTQAGVAGGTPLGFSQLTGVLDATGRASITLTVTAPTAGHPWFDAFRQFYVAVLMKAGPPGVFAQVSAATHLSIQ